MSIFDGIMGNASEIDVSKVEKEMKDLLTPTEKVEHAYEPPTTEVTGVLGLIIN